ncbi:MAG: glycosyltransferase [Oscillospiraceae bacterium]|nr:glycosyltransferase [Oscillospiraceae bacterium]
MKILQINTLYGAGSTGKIVRNLQRYAIKRNHDILVAYRFAEGKIQKNSLPISSWLDCHIHNRLAMITGLQGCFSLFKTWFFLKKIRKYSPDIIHLHNIHGSYINHRMLFNFIKKYHIPVVWTLHDCWAFTGGCPHFDGYSCNKWEHGCKNCPHFAQREGAFFDTSSFVHRKKKKWFSGVNDMTLVCPSQWLANLVGKSFLKNYPVEIIPNGIDLEVFHPVEDDFRKKYGLESKKILLGVSFGWNRKKGLDVFVELERRLPPDYQIVLVGTSESIDAILPKNILSIHRTENQQELAGIYSAADLFVNPTLEENYPTVNMEAIACGTPVITFRTGGSPETIDETCGCVVEIGDIDALEHEIIRICEKKVFHKEACLKKAAEHDINLFYKEYLELYERINIGRNKTN